MARQLAPIENTIAGSVDSALLALRTRTVPWVKPPVAQDPASGSWLILLGRAWLGTRDITAEAILQSFLRDGQIALTRLGGSFGVLVWVPQTQTLVVATDRLATKKIYVWH